MVLSLDATPQVLTCTKLRASEQLDVLDFVLPQVLGGRVSARDRLVSTRRVLPIWKFSLPMK